MMRNLGWLLAMGLIGGCGGPAHPDDATTDAVSAFPKGTKVYDLFVDLPGPRPNPTEEGADGMGAHAAFDAGVTAVAYRVTIPIRSAVSCGVMADNGAQLPISFYGARQDPFASGTKRQDLDCDLLVEDEKPVACMELALTVDNPGKYYVLVENNPNNPAASFRLYCTFALPGPRCPGNEDGAPFYNNDTGYVVCGPASPSGPSVPAEEYNVCVASLCGTAAGCCHKACSTDSDCSPDPINSSPGGSACADGYCQ
jgi:hypothetical protein